MAGRSTQPTSNVRPKMPVRKWYQYLPIFRQGYEDQLSRYQQDYDQWALNEQLRYNEPKSAMERYRQAGLNPNLIYGDISEGNVGRQQDKLQFERPGQTADPTGMVLSRFMDAKMKLAQIKDVEAAATLKGAQATDLLRDIKVKDFRFPYQLDKDGNVVNRVDPLKMNPRERKIYSESEREMNAAINEFYKAGTQKQQEQIMSKINELKNIMMIMSMVTGFGGMLSRFQ